MRLVITLFASALALGQTPATIQQITHDGSANGNLALSADGKLLAFTARFEKRLVLWLHDTTTGTERRVDLGAGSVRSVAFPPDGKSVYFLKSTRPGFQVLYEAKLNGSDVKMRLEDVDSSVAFSPDGKSIAFLRNVPAEGKRHLRILSGGKEREVASWAGPYGGLTEMAWSPDGKQIAAIVRIRARQLLFISISNGEIKEVTAPGIVHGLAWPSGAGGLLVLMGGKISVNAFQLWRYALPSRAWTELTNDESGFRPSQISSNADGTLVAATRMTKVKTGVKDLLSWVGLGDAGPRTNPNVVLIKLPK